MLRHCGMKVLSGCSTLHVIVLEAGRMGAQQILEKEAAIEHQSVSSAQCVMICQISHSF